MGACLATAKVGHYMGEIVAYGAAVIVERGGAHSQTLWEDSDT